MAAIGRRVVVYGPTGSGKSTLAERIGDRISLPVVELDAIFWMSDWENKPLEQFRTDVAFALSSHPEGWVCVGNYGDVRDIVLPQADTVVWIRLPFLVARWQLWRRTIARAWRREALWGTTNRESFRRSFLSRESILLYQLASWSRSLRQTRQALLETSHQPQVVELGSRRTMGEFIDSLQQVTPDTTPAD